VRCSVFECRPQVGVFQQAVDEARGKGVAPTDSVENFELGSVGGVDKAVIGRPGNGAQSLSVAERTERRVVATMLKLGNSVVTLSIMFWKLSVCRLVNDLSVPGISKPRLAVKSSFVADHDVDVAG
jgi:hypothetical protein